MWIASAPRSVDLAGLDVVQKLTACWELTKPRVAALVVAVAWAGFWLGSAGTATPLRAWGTILGVAWLAAGMFALNQCFERALDARMRRTENRPLPSGRLTPREALGFGWTASAAGIVALAAMVNLLSAAIGTITLVAYLFVYTPLKTRSPHCTLLGAFPGAAPPLLGWVAATGQLSPEAWSLFAILFVWQFPHFHSIALLYRDDYAQAGVRLWSTVEPAGTTLGRQTIGFAVLMLPVSLAPALLGMAGPVYIAGALLLGAALLYLAVRTAAEQSRRQAQRLLLGSVLYLPGLLGLMALGK
jgi:protoheme IX farnesyltransferase